MKHTVSNEQSKVDIVVERFIEESKGRAYSMLRIERETACEDPDLIDLDTIVGFREVNGHRLSWKTNLLCLDCPALQK
jgi:hypothetical protein